MSVGLDSRWNYARRIRVVDISGLLVENERLELPIPRVPIVKTSKDNYVEYQVQDGDNWSNIAARFLNGRSDLWWVIADYTGVVDPFRAIYPGAVLRIPPFSEVVLNILSFDRTLVGDPNFPDEVIIPPPTPNVSAPLEGEEMPGIDSVMTVAALRLYDDSGLISGRAIILVRTTNREYWLQDYDSTLVDNSAGDADVVTAPSGRQWIGQ